MPPVLSGQGPRTETCNPWADIFVRKCPARVLERVRADDNPVFPYFCYIVADMNRKSFVGVRERGEIVLPADLRRRHHLDRPGAQVEVVEREDGVIELHPQVAVPADQAWFWDREWQQGERRVDAHLEAGEITVSENVDDFLSDLETVRTTRRVKRAR